MRFQGLFKGVNLGLGLSLVFVAAAAVAAESAPADTSAANRWGFHCYSTFNYYHFDWASYPGRLDAVDLERMAFEFEFLLSPRSVLNSEF